MELILSCTIEEAKAKLTLFRYTKIRNEVYDTKESALYIREKYSLRTGSYYGEVIYISNFSGKTILTAEILGTARGYLKIDFGKKKSAEDYIYSIFKKYIEVHK